MADRKFDLGDYIEVKDRIKLFYELYAQGRLVTTDVRLTSEPDGVPRVLVQAAAYRSPDDPQPGIGWSWMVLPGTTSYTRGSELENTETSAWGRAIAALGILVDKSIASAQEVQNKEGQRPIGQYDAPPDRPQLERHADGLIGIVEVGKSRDSDFELRKSGDDEHFALGFKLKSNGGGFKVLTRNELALQLLDVKDEVVGKRVTVYGRVSTIDPKPGDRWRSYQIIDAERIKTEAGMLPVLPKREDEPIYPGGTTWPLEDGDQPIPVAEGQVPAFDLEESIRLDAAEAQA